MYVVTVTLILHPGQRAAFLPKMLENARASRDTEPGCHRFDTCTDPARPDEVFLYELYTDRAAFEAHLASDHFKRFDQETAAMVATKTVRTYEEHHP